MTDCFLNQERILKEAPLSSTTAGIHSSRFDKTTDQMAIPNYSYRFGDKRV